MLKKTLKMCYFLLCIIAIALTAVTGYYSVALNGNYKITKGTPLALNTTLPIVSEYNGKPLENCDEINDVGNSFSVKLKLFGVIPVTSANVQVVDENYVAVLGKPFGIKMYTDGVLVVDIGSVDTSAGAVRPADNAGIRCGDYILSVNGTEIKNNEDLLRIVEDSKGKALIVKYRRNSKEYSGILVPALSKTDNLFRAGIWVKDSSAGIGTLSFYYPASNIICGLGHGVYDSDTGKIIEFRYGQIVSAQVVTVNKAVSGTIGELKGKITYSNYGEILLNENNGIYAEASCNIDLTNMTKVAFKQDVKNGNATIITTIDSEGPKEYSCRIKVKDTKVNDTKQNMIVTVTDERLKQKTGGIVQGMSGSPIIQNGKLVGIITHVLIDDPTTGYGIFAENMLETAKGVEQPKEAG